MAPPTRVFVSYSHESDEHSSRVLELANRLRDDGIDTWIDRYTKSPAEGWPRWTHNQIDAASFVICVCSAIYRKAFEGHNDPDQGLGVNAEGYAISQDLYDHGNVSDKYIPVLLVDGNYYSYARQDIPSVLRSFTWYAMPNQYEELLARLGCAAITPGDTPSAGSVEPRAVVNDRGFSRQADISEYLRPEMYPLHRLAPADGLFLSRLINPFNSSPNRTALGSIPPDWVMTVWVASNGTRQYILDSARIYDHDRGGLGPSAGVALPLDAKYRFTYHDGSDEELALDPALSVGPDTRSMASFTVSIAPDQPIYSASDLWIWIQYQVSDGQHGAIVLALPFEPGVVLAKLLGQDVLVAAPAGRRTVAMIVTPTGLQRGLEEGYEAPIQIEFFMSIAEGHRSLDLPTGYPGSIGPRDLERVDSIRARWQDIARRRQNLHKELAVNDRLTVLAANLNQGKDWAADILGGMATDSATAILEAKLARDPADPAAFYGLCIRHLERRDDKLAAHIISNYQGLKQDVRSLWQAAAFMVLAPHGELVEVFDLLVAGHAVSWPDALAMLYGHVSSDDWHSLLRHVGGPLGYELYVRGTMNSWASPPPAEAMLKYLGEHRYQVTLSLGPEQFSFKIADASWTHNCNWGGREPGEAALLEERFELDCDPLSHNITLDLSAEPATQSYTFEVNAADILRPVVTVSAVRLSK
jgi:SEFIR domain